MKNNGVILISGRLKVNTGVNTENTGGKYRRADFYRK
jgi:hypothetical protein